MRESSLVNGRVAITMERLNYKENSNGESIDASPMTLKDSCVTHAMASLSAVVFLLTISLRFADGASPAENDWPQLAHDSARSARASQGIPPPYRARWIWFGPEKTLRNRAANPAWPDDLAVGTKAGFDYPTPERVSFTLAGRAQPVVAKGRAFIGDIDGKVYGLSADDGKTLWIGENPGGTCAALAVVGDVVVAGSIHGGVTGFDVADGRIR